VHRCNVTAVHFFGGLDLRLPLYQAQLICGIRFVWSKRPGQEALPSRAVCAVVGLVGSTGLP